MSTHRERLSIVGDADALSDAMRQAQRHPLIIPRRPWWRRWFR